MDEDSRVYCLAVLRAWEERDLEPFFAELFAKGGGLMRSLLPGDRQVVRLMVERRLREEGEEMISSFEFALNEILPEPEPILPELTIPFLRRIAGDDRQESSLTAGACAILARWRIPGGVECLCAALSKSEGLETAVEGLAGHPEVLEYPCVQGAFIAHIAEVREEEDSDDAPTVLLDALVEHYARSPIAGAIPVLERIARSDLPSASRAALRLVCWEVPGSRELLTKLLEENCWAYTWSAKERAELPEDLRAWVAARE
jgi:hypothetical protein